MNELPDGATKTNGKVYDVQDKLIELADGKWQRVLNGDRGGWWRYHDHYDRNGYCDNPGRGY